MSDQPQDTTTEEVCDAWPIGEAPLAECGRHFSMRERVQLLDRGGSVPARDESGRVVVLDVEGRARLLAKGRWARGAEVIEVGDREVSEPIAGSMVVLTNEFVTDEAAGEMESLESQADVDAVRRRVDRTIGLLRALPHGWHVERWDELVGDRKLGNDFRVIDARGDVRGRAGRRRSFSALPPGETRQAVNWGGHMAGSAGDAWAAGIALMLAAIDAEAHGPADL